MTVGNGPLTITASHYLEKFGVRTSQPVVVDWRWYYHLPSLAFWALVMVPLVLVKDNRRRTAWAILIPLLAILVAFRMFATLVAMPPDPAETIGSFVATLITAWAMVWLLEPWLSGRRPRVFFFSALAVMLGTGLLSYAGHYGLARSDSTPPLLICYTTAAVGLLLSMTLSSRCCRKVYSPGRFMTWLLLWAVLLVIVGLVVFAAYMSAGERFVGELISSLPSVLLAGGIAGFVLYLLNLPFMLLAFRSDFYRQRFCRMWRLKALPDQGAATAL